MRAYKRAIIKFYSIYSALFVQFQWFIWSFCTLLIFQKQWI